MTDEQRFDIAVAELSVDMVAACNGRDSRHVLMCCTLLLVEASEQLGMSSAELLAHVADYCDAKEHA
jgi:hypothetical protein